MLDGLVTILLLIWQGYAPELLLLAAVLLICLGYPVAFTLGGVALIFTLIGAQSGLLDIATLESLPSQFFNHILLDPALLSLPLLVFFCELLISSRYVERAALVLKGPLGQPSAVSNHGANSGKEANKKHPRAHPNGSTQTLEPQRTVFMTVFVPGALLGLLIARLFDLSPEYLTFALLPIIGILSMLYGANWVLDVWMRGDLIKCKENTIHSSEENEEAKPHTLKSQLLLDLLPLPIIGLLALTLLVHFKATLFATLTILSMLMLLLSLLGRNLRIATIVTLLNRAVLTSGGLAALLLAAFGFHAVFLALGGEQSLDKLTEALFALGEGGDSWLPLLLLLCGLTLLGFVFDWLILTTLALPLLLPIFAQMQFNSLLMPIWAGSSSMMAAINPADFLSTQDVSLQTRLWLATLVWLALMVALVTYAKQNGGVGTKRLAPEQGSDEYRRVNALLFFVLQLIGLAAILIAPQLTLWLPSLLIG